MAKKISLSGLKLPNINVWDSMGILGLSSKMFSDTSSTGRFSAAGLVRRHSVTTHTI